MNQTKSGNRVVVIGPTASAAKRATHREPIGRRAPGRRIVVIKDGELVGSRRGR
jgi:hypothetical protein